MLPTKPHLKAKVCILVPNGQTLRKVSTSFSTMAFADLSRLDAKADLFGVVYKLVRARYLKSCHTLERNGGGARRFKNH